MSNLSLAVKSALKVHVLISNMQKLYCQGVVGNVYLGNIDWSCKEIG